MRILNGPDVGSSYQRLLHGHLVQIGIDHQQFQARSLLPLTKATRTDASILHLDWLHPFYASPESAKAHLKRMHLQLDVRLMRKIPLVWNVHNLVSHGGTAQQDDEGARPLLDRIDVFVSFTQAGLNQIRDRWSIAKSRQVVVIPHGNFIGAYPDTISAQEARRQLKLPQDARIALFLGRVHRYKGCEELVSSFRKVAGKNDWLVIAGELEDAGLGRDISILAAGQDRICLHFGKIRDDQIQLFFRAADFCVYPFRNIFNSGAVMLALSFAKPVLAPSTEVLSEVAGSEALLPLSPAPNGLDQGLEAAFGSPRLRERGAIGYERVATRNAWPDIARTFKELYISLCETR